MRVAALSRILGTKKMHSDFNAPLECPVTGNPFSGRSPNVFLWLHRLGWQLQERIVKTNKNLADQLPELTKKDGWMFWLLFFREQSSVQYTFLALGLWIHCCHEYVSYNIITRQYKSGVWEFMFSPPRFQRKRVINLKTEEVWTLDG